MLTSKSVTLDIEIRAGHIYGIINQLPEMNIISVNMIETESRIIDCRNSRRYKRQLMDRTMRQRLVKYMKPGLILIQNVDAVRADIKIRRLIIFLRALSYTANAAQIATRQVK